MNINTKELIKIKDPKILKRKISIHNVLNDTNYTLNDFGIFEYENKLNYYGIPFEEIDFNKLNQYKRNYKIIKRWMIWILNNCEVKKDLEINTISYYFFSKRKKFILKESNSLKYFAASDINIFKKLELKFNYTNYTITHTLFNILKNYFKYSDNFYIKRMFLTTRIVKHKLIN